MIGTSNKQKLVNRYLYEHLFQAHLHFANSADREFYRLIRLSTPPGQPADEIASVLPLDASGSSAFYYRVILENDTMTVIKGLEGSYPNFFYNVDLDATEAPKEGDEILSIKNRQDYEKFVANFGIRRTSNTFWQTADWFQARAREEQPVLSGIYDLNRYRNY